MELLEWRRDPAVTRLKAPPRDKGAAGAGKHERGHRGQHAPRPEAAPRHRTRAEIAPGVADDRLGLVFAVCKVCDYRPELASNDDPANIFRPSAVVMLVALATWGAFLAA